MATREELEVILAKASLTPAEDALLRAEANRLNADRNQDVVRLKNLRLKNGLTRAEHDEVDSIRKAIGADIKFAARMNRKTGQPVESVW
jgi:hypothetical protein